MIGAGINDKLHEERSKLANSQKKHCCQSNWNDRAREIPGALPGCLISALPFEILPCGRHGQMVPAAHL